MRIKYFMIGLSLLLFGCKEPKFNEDDFVGIWKAEDGAVIEIYYNGRCKATGLNYYNIYPFNEHKNRQLNFEGTWDFTNGGDAQLHLSYNEGKTYHYKGETKEYKAGFDLSILGKGLFGNKPPFDLYKYIGDPDDIDESNKYRFVKQ